MIKYLVGIGSWASAKITPVEIERETEHSVWVNGNRNKRHTANDKYCDTWDEAKTLLMVNASNRVEVARNNLARAKDFMGNVKGLKA